MQVYFDNGDLEELITEGESRKYKKYTRDARFMEALDRVYKIMLTVDEVSDLTSYSFLHYERLKHRPESSVRILNNRVERLLFREEENGICITLIEIDDKHYGNKR